MKTLFIFFSFSLIFLIEGIAQNNEFKRGKYKTWYKLSSPSCKEKGITFSVKDSSLILVRTMYYKPNTNYTDYDYMEIPYQRIQTFKAQKYGSMLIGATLGTLAGAGLGALFGYAVAPEDDDGLVIGVFSFLGGALGLSIGAAIGSAKTIIPINGNRETFAKEKSRLENYSAKKF
jgi:hypothetical protein